MTICKLVQLYRRREHHSTEHFLQDLASPQHPVVTTYPSYQVENMLIRSKLYHYRSHPKDDGRQHFHFVHHGDGGNYPHPVPDRGGGGGRVRTPSPPLGWMGVTSPSWVGVPPPAQEKEQQNQYLLPTWRAVCLLYSRGWTFLFQLVHLFIMCQKALQINLYRMIWEPDQIKFRSVWLVNPSSQSI